MWVALVKALSWKCREEWVETSELCRWSQPCSQCRVALQPTNLMRPTVRMHQCSQSWHGLFWWLGLTVWEQLFWKKKVCVWWRIYTFSPPLCALFPEPPLTLQHCTAWVVSLPSPFFKLGSYGNCCNRAHMFHLRESWRSRESVCISLYRANLDQRKYFCWLEYSLNLLCNTY